MLYGYEQGETFLDRMILNGKILYFLDAMLPFEEDEIKISYTNEQLDWCHSHEANLWQFFIENELLYETEITLINKFFNDGPFTRGFEGSPARLGSWMGWQIVRAYMNQNPEISLQQLLDETNSQKILSGSDYKPKK
jgi:hypothetical protein